MYEIKLYENFLMLLGHSRWLNDLNLNETKEYIECTSREIFLLMKANEKRDDFDVYFNPR